MYFPSRRFLGRSFRTRTLGMDAPCANKPSLRRTGGTFSSMSATAAFHLLRLDSHVWKTSPPSPLARLSRILRFGTTTITGTGGWGHCNEKRLAGPSGRHLQQVFDTRLPVRGAPRLGHFNLELRLKGTHQSAWLELGLDEVRQAVVEDALEVLLVPRCGLKHAVNPRSLLRVEHVGYLQ